MNRLLELFIVGSVAVATTGLGAMSWAANEDTSPQGTRNSSQIDPQAGPSDKPASEASDKSNKSEEQKEAEVYSAKLKKCETMRDDTQKQQCIEKAIKDRNQM